MGLRNAQRAGIPIDEASAHVGATPAELWAAGETNRAAVMADERLKVSSGRWWGREAPGDWSFTECSFTS